MVHPVSMIMLDSVGACNGRYGTSGVSVVIVNIIAYSCIVIVATIIYRFVSNFRFPSLSVVLIFVLIVIAVVGRLIVIIVIDTGGTVAVTICAIAITVVVETVVTITVVVDSVVTVTVVAVVTITIVVAIVVTVSVITVVVVSIAIVVTVVAVIVVAVVVVTVVVVAPVSVLDVLGTDQHIGTTIACIIPCRCANMPIFLVRLVWFVLPLWDQH